MARHRSETAWCRSWASRWALTSDCRHASCALVKRCSSGHSDNAAKSPKTKSSLLGQLKELLVGDLGLELQALLPPLLGPLVQDFCKLTLEQTLLLLPALLQNLSLKLCKPLCLLSASVDMANWAGEASCETLRQAAHCDRAPGSFPIDQRICICFVGRWCWRIYWQGQCNSRALHQILGALPHLREASGPWIGSWCRNTSRLLDSRLLESWNPCT